MQEFLKGGALLIDRLIEERVSVDNYRPSELMLDNFCTSLINVSYFWHARHLGVIMLDHIDLFPYKIQMPAYRLPSYFTRTKLAHLRNIIFCEFFEFSTGPVPVFEKPSAISFIK